MQCPSCDHQAPQAEFGAPLRCPECGAFYEKAVALKLQSELAKQRTQLTIAREAIRPQALPQPKKKTSWAVWVIVGLMVIGWIGILLDPPPATQSEEVNTSPAVSPLKQAAPVVIPPSPTESALTSARLEYKWGKKHETLMVANFTVINNGYSDIKDIEIECVHSGPSGTRIDSNKRTIYEVVPARGRKVFNGFDMGFIHSQAVKSVCSIIDLKV